MYTKFERGRLALQKSVNRELKQRVRGRHWFYRDNFVFRSLDGWYLEGVAQFRLDNLSNLVQLRHKPMDLDPIFWEIEGISSNEKKPLSFRSCGAWTVTAPVAAEGTFPEFDGQADKIATYLFNWLNEQVHTMATTRNLPCFIETLEGLPRCDSYFVTNAPYVCALVLDQQYNKAIKVIDEGIQRGESGGFGSTLLPEGTTFFKNARQWIDAHR